MLDEGLYGWGKNDEGALGIGGEIEGDRPKRIEMHSKVLKVQCTLSYFFKILFYLLFFLSDLLHFFGVNYLV